MKGKSNKVALALLQLELGINETNSLCEECSKLAKEGNWTKEDTNRVIAEYREIEAKANKYDSLVEKMIKELKDIQSKYIENVAKIDKEELFNIRMEVFRGIQLEGQRKVLQELLDTEK